MDLRLVEIFCCVYEERSFSRAARRLALSQPTVSGHVKSLEDHFRTPLFDRLGREIRPTAAGRLLFRFGSRILETKTAAAHAMTAFLDCLEGDLEIGASTIPGEYLLPRSIGRFRNDYPKIDVHLTIRDSRQVVDLVADGAIEIGFVGARLNQSRLLYRFFASDELVLAAPTTPDWSMDAVSLAELEQRPLLVREPGSGTRLMMEHRLRELGKSLEDFQVAAELGSTTAVKEAVKSGLGASVLSTIAVEQEIEAGWIRRVRIREFGTLRRDFYCVIDPKRTFSPLAEAFLEMFAPPRT